MNYIEDFDTQLQPEELFDEEMEELIWQCGFDEEYF